MTLTSRRAWLAVIVAGCISTACGTSGKSASPGSPGGSGSGDQPGGATGTDGGSTSGDDGGVGHPYAGQDGGLPPATATPFDSKTAFAAVRKVKDLLVGMPPTDDEVASVVANGEVGLQQLIGKWTSDTATMPFFENKMLFFFRNTFQQIGFTPTDDFKPQLLENGGFDFGPFGVSAVGDDAFGNLVQNLQDSFARTAWAIVQEGQPFTSTLTTQRFMMTTALKMLYLQIEMPNDQPYSFVVGQKAIPWKVDFSGNAIALTDTLDPSSPNYMVFDDEPPVNKGSFFGGGSQFPTCRGGTTTDPTTMAVVTTGSYTGYAQLFQRLIGYTPRYPFSANPTCWEHPSKPYVTESDTSDWQWVTIRQKTSADSYVQPYDLPTLRTTTTLALALPRIGFYTTPAFLALWNTNNSNQHRVTANQALLAALGESFTSDALIVPLSETGLDPSHAVTGTECYGCHKSLDPMREFWANQFDFNDRNDFLTNTFTGNPPNPRPATTGGTFAFATVNSSGASMTDFGPLLGQVTDGDPTSPLDQFALGVTQKLCSFANSNPCDPTDPVFRRVVSDFQNASYDFMQLVTELFASPLVTGAEATKTFDVDAVPVSIARRDHFCQALSNRLGLPDICALVATLPTTAQTATSTIAGSVVADAFSRGSQTPVTPGDPNVFFRAAIEELCENLATQVVDPTGGATAVFPSSDVTGSVKKMVQQILGYPPSDSHYAQAVQILQAHDQAVLPQSNATNALRSTFVLACESPTSLSLGL